MKKLITKLMTLFMLVFVGVLNVNAQTTTYAGTFPITLQGFTQSITDPITAGWAGTTASPTTSARNGKCFTTANDGNFNTNKFITYRVPSCGTISLQANGTVGRGFIVTITKVSDATQLSRTVWAYSTATCSSQDFVVNSAVPVNITILSPSTVEGAITATGSSYISYVNISGLPSPVITAFNVVGVSATINSTVTPATITATLPFGTSLTSLAPTVTLGGSATSFTPTGAQDFTNTVNYIASDGTNTKTYAVTLTVSTVPSTDNSITGVTIGGYTPVYNTGTSTFNAVLPKGTSLTQAVNFTIPSTATANFTSGSTMDFNTPQSIIVTAQDGSQKTYNFSAVNGIANLAYVTVDGLVSTTDTQVYPDLVSKGYYLKLINASSYTDLTPFATSDLVILTESPNSGTSLLATMSGLIGVKPFLSMKSFMYGKTGWPTGAGANGTSDLGANVLGCYLNHPIFLGVTFSGNTASILTSGITGNGIQGVTTPGAGIIMANLPSASTAACIIEQNSVPAAKYLLIPIATANYGAVNASGLKLIENSVSYLLGSSIYTLPSLQISSFTVNSISATIDHTAGTITAQLSIGTDLTALQPAIVLQGTTTTVSPLAGVATDFSNSNATPVTYTVTDGCNSKVYAVTITDATTGMTVNSITGVSFDGQTIHNQNNHDLQVFDVTGRMILQTNRDINMSSNSKGIYFVKSHSGTLKIALIN